MKQKHKTKKLTEPDTNIDRSVVSSTECTGLTSTMPRDDAQASALEEIYDVPLTRQNDTTAKERKTKKQDKT
jgi:hypothetical protein